MKTAHKCPTCGAQVLFPVSAELPLERLLLEWVEGLTLEGRSFIYTKLLRQRARDYIFPYFKDTDVRAIKAIHVKQFYHSLLKGPVRPAPHSRKTDDALNAARPRLSSKTVKHILDTLKAFMGSLKALDVLEFVPAFPAVKVIPAREKAWIDQAKQKAVLRAISPGHRLAFEVLFETGIRPSEGAALKKKDLHDQGVSIVRAFDERGQVKETKTGQTEYKALSAPLYAKLLKHSQRSLPQAWLFLRASGKPHTGKSLYKIWQRACRAEGVSISLYCATRHSKASQVRATAEAAANETIRAALGHTNARTTLKHYALGKEAKI